MRHHCRGRGHQGLEFQRANVSLSREKLGNFLNTHFLPFFFPVLSVLRSCLHSHFCTPLFFSEKTGKPTCTQPRRAHTSLKSKGIHCDSLGETHGVCPGWVKHGFPALCPVPACSSVRSRGCSGSPAHVPCCDLG